MIDRIKELRTVLKLSQNKFAQSLKLNGSYFCQLEKRNVPINDRIVQLICLTHGVREEWLRTGEGEMFAAPKPPVELSERDVLERYVVKIFRELSEENQELILDVAGKLVAQFPRKKKSTDAA